MDATNVAINLAKDVFELAFADTGGRIVERRRLSRSAFSRCLLRCSPLPVVVVARCRLNDRRRFATFIMGERARSAGLPAALANARIWMCGPGGSGMDASKWR
jgi:hypothetical protein